MPLRDGAYRILVRATETRGAQRFTVAHELIELGLQIGCPALVERSYHDAGAGRAKERFCEAGAAEILMPLARVQEELAARGAGIAALPALSALFGASLHATLRRMVEAAPTPCAGLILYDYRCAVPPQGGPAMPRAPSEGPSACTMAVAAGSRLCVRGACSGGPVAAAPAGAAIPVDSVLTRCYRERAGLCAVEHLALGPLRGRFRVEAICPGRGERRHVYALLYPC